MEDLLEIFKVSQIDVEAKERLDSGLISQKYPDIAVVVKKAEGEKCIRCWNYSTSVGKNKSHPLICDRCGVALSLKM